MAAPIGTGTGRSGTRTPAPRAAQHPVAADTERDPPHSPPVEALHRAGGSAGAVAPWRRARQLAMPPSLPAQDDGAPGRASASSSARPQAGTAVIRTTLGLRPDNAHGELALASCG